MRPENNAGFQRRQIGAIEIPRSRCSRVGMAGGVPANPPLNRSQNCRCRGFRDPATTLSGWKSGGYNGGCREKSMTAESTSVPSKLMECTQ